MSDHQSVSKSNNEPQQPSETGMEQTPAPDSSLDYLRGIVASGADEQARALTHPKLDRVQRRIMAASIAQRRGNSHMRNVVGSIQRAAFPTPNTALNATPRGTLDQIRKELDTGWVGPLGEYELERLWGTYGDHLPTTLEDAEAWGLFLQSYNRGAEVDELAPVEAIKKKFTDDVRDVAVRYLNSNEQVAKKELESIGVSDNKSMQFTEDHQKKLKSLQEAAGYVDALQKMMKDLRQIPVGYVEIEPTYPVEGIDITHNHDPVPFNFNPSSRPDKPPKPEDGWPSWDEVNAVYLQSEGAIAGFAEKFPAIYALIGNPDDLAKFASTDNPQEAQAILTTSLNGVMEAIGKSRTAIKGSDLDPRELKPIHAKLRSGAEKGNSQTDWSKPFYKWASERAVGDYESTEFWIAIGLGTIAAVGLIVAEIATFGSATFIIAAGVGALATGAQVAKSWDQYIDISRAKNSSLSKDTELVTQDQVDAALLAAILDTGFALIDLAGAVKGGLTAAKAAGRLGALAKSRKVLSEIGQMAAKDAEPLMKNAITELGIEEAIRKTGKSKEELLSYFGADSEVGKMIKTGAKTGALSDMAKLVDIAATDSALAQKLALEALEANGAEATIRAAGGWSQFTKAIGNEAEAAKRVHQWRKSIFDELEQYVNKNLKRGNVEGRLVEDTGSKAPTSDLDMSFLGPHSGENRMQAMEWMRGRLGIKGRDDLLTLLDMEMFTDPVRKLLTKELPADVAAEVSRLTAAQERGLIFAERLHDAQEMAAKGGIKGKEGEKLVEQIRAQMSRLNVPEVPYKPLTRDEAFTASRMVDELHQSFNAATDLQTRIALAKQIAEHQGLINAAEKGGYLSGGGVERYVKNRELLEKMRKDAGGEIVKYFDDPALLTAALDQMLKLDHYAIELKAVAGKLAKGGKDAPKLTEMAEAVKAVAKYGERLSDVTGSLMVGGTGASNLLSLSAGLDEASGVLSKLIASTKEGAAVPLTNQLIDDGIGTVQRTMAALDKLDSAVDGLLTKMQTQAGLDGVQGGLEAMEAMLRAKTTQFAATEAVRKQMQWLLPKLQKAGTLIGKGANQAPDDPANADPNDPNGPQASGVGPNQSKVWTMDDVLQSPDF